MGRLTRNDRQVPDGWQVVRLGDVAEVAGGSTPSRTNTEFWGRGIPWVVPSELTKLQGRYLKATKESITYAGLKSTGLKIIPAGSILLTSRATIGVTAINTIPLVTNQGFQNLVVKSGVAPLWLYYGVSAMRRELGRRAAGSTFLEVSRDSVRSLPILLPPLPEQRAIAAVLDSIDEATERTDAVIAATERMRDALLHELLTRGVPGWHTEWKEAPGIGAIPACWEVVRLGDESERITKGTTPTTLGRQYTSSGVRFLRVENISDDGTITGGKLRFIDQDTHSILSRSILRGNDLVLSIAGALGRSALVTGDVLPANLNQALAIIRLSPASRILPVFFSYVLRGRAIQEQINGMRVELAQANVSLRQVGMLRIPIPHFAEQLAIANTLDCVNAANRQAREERDGLQSLKNSMGEALLTAKIRMPTDRFWVDD